MSEGMSVYLLFVIEYFFSLLFENYYSGTKSCKSQW